jgi:hypothetical protein
LNLFRILMMVNLACALCSIIKKNTNNGGNAQYASA